MEMEAESSAAEDLKISEIGEDSGGEHFKVIDTEHAGSMGNIEDDMLKITDIRSLDTDEAQEMKIEDSQPRGILDEQSSSKCDLNPADPNSSVSQEDEATTKLHQWLEANYVPQGSVLLLRRLIYQHYSHYCSITSVANPLDEVSLQQFLCKKYPHMQVRKFRVGPSSYYVQGLDIREESDEYDTVVKGRKFDFLQSEHLRTKKRKRSTKLGEEMTAEKKEEKLVSELWIKQSWETKELHRKMVYQWLEENYELSPLMCLLRISVYEHYSHFCAENNLQRAPQNYFGRLVPKKFPAINMRRLGSRGESRYYYMGIDIRDSSPFYKQVSQERVVSTVAKPKKNRPFATKRKSIY